MKTINCVISTVLIISLSGCVNHDDNIVNSTPVNNKIIAILDSFKEKNLHCLEQIETLKINKSDKQNNLIYDYKRIIEQQHFLTRNQDVMDNDSFTYLSNSLMMKLETLCNKIEFTNFSIIKDRTQSLINQLN